jgi:hypothetical protein
MPQEVLKQVVVPKVQSIDKVIEVPEVQIIEKVVDVPLNLTYEKTTTLLEEELTAEQIADLEEEGYVIGATAQESLVQLPLGATTQSFLPSSYGGSSSVGVPLKTSYGTVGGQAYSYGGSSSVGVPLTTSYGTVGGQAYSYGGMTGQTFSTGALSGQAFSYGGVTGQALSTSYGAVSGQALTYGAVVGEAKVLDPSRIKTAPAIRKDDD